MPLISLDDDDQRWVPTHVNVTVLRARGLRTKGKHGSRYVYTIIQLGKEKYTTGLVEKAAEPEWNEECTFELLPGLLELAGTSAYPPGSSNLVLTVMHRVLIGLDVFLGQTIVPLDKIFQDGVCPRNEWFKLHSKAGRPEKERGDLQVTVQFTRNNLTASMYDLSVKDKHRSAFGKLKDRVTGKKRDLESSSAIVPGRYAALSGSTGQPLGEGTRPEDEQPEEHPVVERERRGSKVKDFFGKLRKSSDTRSCSSLASDGSMASSAGEPFCPPVELSSTPIYSSRVVTDSFRGDTETGGKAFTPHDPKLMTHKRAYSDEASKVTTTPSTSAVPRPCPAVESLALSKSSLCINGSHVYASEPASSKVPNPGGVLPARRALLEKCSPLSRSLQNLTRRTDDPQRAALSAGDGRRWSFDKSKREEADVEQTAAQGAGSTTDESPSQAAAAAGAMGTETSDKGKKLRRTLFSSGRSDSLPAKSDHGPSTPAYEGRLKGWFGSSDSQNKPSPEVSPKVENSPDTPSPLHLRLNGQPQSLPQPQSLDPLPTHPTPVPPSPANGCHTNPFTTSPPTPTPTAIPISPSNPFLTRLQTNPFFEELLAEEALKSPPAVGSGSMGYAATPLSQYAAHFAQPGFSSPGHCVTLRERTSIKRERPRSMSRQRSLPVLLPGSTGPRATASSLPNSATNRSLSEHGTTEWDESFEAFAASRLKSPSSTVPSAPNSATRQNVNTSVFEDHITHTVVDARVSGGQEELSQLTDVPPLPPRRPIGPPRDRSSDSWLERAEELAVLREASFLTQTELASRQHTRERKHKRNAKSWALGDKLPAEGTDTDLVADLAHYHGNVCLTSTITEVAETSDINNRVLTIVEEGGRASSSERESPGAQERRNMERKNNALNSCHFDKDVVFNMALGFAADNAFDKSLIFDEGSQQFSPILVSSVKNSEKAQKTFARLDMDSLGKSHVECSLRTDCTAKSKLTNGVGSFVGSTPDANKNLDSSDFAFVDSDSSPSEMTINNFEIYDQNANKMLTAYQMFSAINSSGNPISPPDLTAMNSDLSPSELEMLSSTMPSFAACEPELQSEQCVLKADSLGVEQRDCSPHYKSSCEGKGGCETHGTASFNKEISPGFGEERHTYFNCELPQHPLNPKKQEVYKVVSSKAIEEELTPTPPTCVSQSPRLGSPNRNNDSLPDPLCNKGGCVAGELSLPQALHEDSNNQRPSQTLDQQNAQCGGSVSDSTKSEGLSEGIHRDREPNAGDMENHGGNHHMRDSDLSDLETSQAMSFADLHASVAPSPSSALGPTGSSPHESTSPSAHHTPPSGTNTTPDPHPNNAKREAGGVNNLAPLTSCFCTSTPSPTSTSTPCSSCSTCTVQPMDDARHNATPGEKQPASLLPHPESSPHPVKPLTTSTSAIDRKSEGRSVLEKLKSTIHPGRSAQPTAAEVAEREARLSEARAQYQTMTNMELISLLLQQEVEVERQREEAELQGALLEKREAELKKMKVQVRDLEDYIDKLLVRIMEQTPTLLQKTTVKPNS